MAIPMGKKPSLAVAIGIGKPKPKAAMGGMGDDMAPESSDMHEDEGDEFTEAMDTFIAAVHDRDTEMAKDAFKMLHDVCGAQGYDDDSEM